MLQIYVKVRERFYCGSSRSAYESYKLRWNAVADVLQRAFVCRQRLGMLCGCIRQRPYKPNDYQLPCDACKLGGIRFMKAFHL